MDPTSDPYGRDYFENGRALGLSWYENYRWMPERSRAEAKAFLDAMAPERCSGSSLPCSEVSSRMVAGRPPGDRSRASCAPRSDPIVGLVTRPDSIQELDVTDYGCAKGFFVRALHELGVYARGVDVSDYALGCAEAPWRHFLYHVDQTAHLEPTALGFCKDTLEHCRPGEELGRALACLRRLARRWLVVVPLAQWGAYRIPEYEQDVTHVLREPEDYWRGALEGAGLRVVETKHRVPGLKDNWAHYPYGNLFLFAESES